MPHEQEDSPYSEESEDPSVGSVSPWVANEDTRVLTREDITRLYSKWLGDETLSTEVKVTVADRFADMMGWKYARKPEEIDGWGPEKIVEWLFKEAFPEMKAAFVLKEQGAGAPNPFSKRRGRKKKADEAIPE